MEDAAHRPDNSHTSGGKCSGGSESIVYCRTDAGHDDKFCRYGNITLRHHIECRHLCVRSYERHSKGSRLCESEIVYRRAR